MPYNYKLTIFTASYNRAHTLGRLYESIANQDCVEQIEWLIVDDCSKDNTEALVLTWIEEHRVQINYHKVSENGGKPRAINLACELARSPYLFIVDSDDYLEKSVVAFILDKIGEVALSDDYNAIGLLQADKNGRISAKPNFKGYVDATNLERWKYGLNFDCNEVYKISVLKKYPFYVWDGEIFTPESTVLNAMAEDGYKVRWYNKVGVIAEYQADGMTKGSWQLQKRNPMGYAMLFNSNLKYCTTFKSQVGYAAQFVAQCLLGKNWKYISRCNSKKVLTLGILLGFGIYMRRLYQYRVV